MFKLKKGWSGFEKSNEKILRTYICYQDSLKHEVLAIGAYVLAVSITIETVALATQPAQPQDLISVVTNVLTELSGTILRLSTAAALIGVGTGAFFKKLSFGKPDRIETGNKLIVNSIWGWVLLNGLTTILGWAGGHLGVDPEITFGESPVDTINDNTATNGTNDLIIGQ